MANIIVPNIVQQGMTLLSTTTLSGATTTVSAIPNYYNMLIGYVRLPLPATDTAGLRLRLNSNSSATYAKFASSSANSTTQTFASTEIDLAAGQDNAVTQAFCYFDIPDYANTTTWKMVRFYSAVNDGTTTTSIRNFAGYTIWNQTSTIDSLQFLMNSGNLTSGTLLLYGVK